MGEELAIIAAGRSGVYRLDARIDVSAVDLAAQEKGYYFAHIDGSAARTSRDLLPMISAALHFPDYFGNNWDALADMLGDLSWLASDGYAGQVILLNHIDHLRNQDSAGYGSLNSVLHHVIGLAQDIEDTWPVIVLIAS